MVVAQSTSGDVALHYVLPILWMTSRLAVWAGWRCLANGVAILMSMNALVIYRCLACCGNVERLNCWVFIMIDSRVISQVYCPACNVCLMHCLAGWRKNAQSRLYSSFVRLSLWFGFCMGFCVLIWLLRFPGHQISWVIE